MTHVHAPTVWDPLVLTKENALRKNAAEESAESKKRF
jgi:hypothetical protein